MARGDHIKVRRYNGLYSHHGIDMGDGTVIHLSGEPLRRQGARVCRTTLETFLQGGKLRVVSYPEDLRTAEAVAAGAEALLAQQDYNLLRNNCEHFATWCKTGRRESHQVRRLLRIAAASAGASVAIVLPLLAVRRTLMR